MAKNLLRLEAFRVRMVQRIPLWLRLVILLLLPLLFVLYVVIACSLQRVCIG